MKKAGQEQKKQNEMVGIELGSGASEGTPAVCIRRQDGGGYEVVAAAYLGLDSAIPVGDTSLMKQGLWALPKAFQVPSAAFSVTSPDAVLRQASGVEEALVDKGEVAYRTAAYATEEHAMPFVAALPEHVAFWAAHLLPEGHRPTAVSIQVTDLARVNAFMASPLFAQSNGTALLLIAGAESTALVIFHEFLPILYRKHSIGSRDVLDAVCKKMNLDEATVQELLNDNLVDPTAVIEPVLSPLFRQAELSVDYAVRMKGCFVDQFYLMGLETGGRYWSTVFKLKTGAEIVEVRPSELLPLATGADVPPNFEHCARHFVPAMGAAVAALEGV